jgi:peptidoglycan/LPS O-acetylase OafA/YrhL
MADNRLPDAPQDVHLPRFWIKPYYRSFNGLRGLAVALVFVCHYSYFWRPQHFWLASKMSETLWVGVDLFFVLSGFLITGILYDSLQDPDYFRNFYVRRALRIFPVFYGFFALLGVLIVLLHLHAERGMLAFVFYAGNLTMPFYNLGAHDPSVIELARPGHFMVIGNLSHLWSLCLEEQFYLLWPAVVLWVRDRRRLMRLCVAVSIATLALRLVLYPLAMRTDPRLIEHHLLMYSTYTRCDTLLTGAWLALFLRGRALSLRQLRRASGWLFGTSAALLALGELAWRGHGIANGPFTLTAGYTLIAVASAAVILNALDDDGLLSRLLRNRALSALGIVSYGFYFYHVPVFGLWEDLGVNRPQLAPVIPLLAFAVTALLAWLSFRCFESPFLRLKRRLAPQRAGGNAEGFVPARLHVPEPEPES